MIAQKLTNDEYDNIDSLNQEIHGFLDYFHEEGPKGPNSMNIAQMFCYDKMLEGSHFFLENRGNFFLKTERLTCLPLPTLIVN